MLKLESALGICAGPRFGKGHAIVNAAAKAVVDHGGCLRRFKKPPPSQGCRRGLPSIIDTEANRKAMPGGSFAIWPKPEEIARVIVFLCSGGARVIHGASVPVYGYT